MRTGKCTVQELSNIRWLCGEEMCFVCMENLSDHLDRVEKSYHNTVTTHNAGFVGVKRAKKRVVGRDRSWTRLLKFLLSKMTNHE